MTVNDRIRNISVTALLLVVLISLGSIALITLQQNREMESVIKGNAVVRSAQLNTLLCVAQKLPTVSNRQVQECFSAYGLGELSP